MGLACNFIIIIVIIIMSLSYQWNQYLMTFKNLLYMCCISQLGREFYSKPFFLIGVNYDPLILLFSHNVLRCSVSYARQIALRNSETMTY